MLKVLNKPKIFENHMLFYKMVANFIHFYKK